MNPAVSIIITTLNSGPYISRCLNSLKLQTFSDFEVLIVDAGSRDETKQIVGQFDGRFRWLELPGSDMGMARNHGVAASRGRFIMFLDSDDCYLSKKVERQVEMLNCSSEDVVFCSIWAYRSGQNDRVGRKREVAPHLLNFLRGYNENLNTMCMRRSVWDAGFKFGEGDRGRYGEEWRLQLSMAAGGVSIRKANDPLVVVEIRPDSHTIWSRQWIMKQQALDEVGRVYETLTPSQRMGIEIDAIKDGFRLKLVPALLIESKRKEAAQVIEQMAAGPLRRRATLLLQLTSLMPGNLFEKLLPALWLLRQNKSFCWERVGKDLRRELDGIAVSHTAVKA